MGIEGPTYSVPDDMATMTREQLLQEKDRCMKAMIDIDGQLEFDELSGENNLEWRIRARTARRHASREMQAIDQRLSAQGSSRMEKEFVKVVKRRFDLETFTEILDEAKENARAGATR